MARIANATVPFELPKLTDTQFAEKFEGKKYATTGATAIKAGTRAAQTKVNALIECVIASHEGGDEQARDAWNHIVVALGGSVGKDGKTGTAGKDWSNAIGLLKRHGWTGKDLRARKFKSASEIEAEAKAARDAKGMTPTNRASKEDTPKEDTPKEAKTVKGTPADMLRTAITAMEAYADMTRAGHAPSEEERLALTHLATMLGGIHSRVAKAAKVAA